MRVACLLLLCVSACQFDTSGLPGASADAGTATSDARAATPLRIATVNLRCLLDDWDARRDAVVAELAAFRPALVGLQEVCHDDSRDALVELQQHLVDRTGRGYTAVRTDTHLAWDQYTEGVAVLVDQTVVDSAIIELPPGLFPRSAVAVRAGGVWFASTHLSYGDQATVRQAQMSALVDAMARLGEPGDSRVIAGDFNEDPGGLVLTTVLAEGYADVWSSLHPDDPGPTFPSSAPDVRIDYVLLASPDGQFRPTQVARFLDKPDHGIMPSDHLGVQAVLSR